jgi:hypothetical protein
MSAKNPTQFEKESFQLFYVACRRLYSQNIVYKVAVQKAFEEAIHGFTKENSWRPTHISRRAAVEALRGNSKCIQRAHGVLAGKLDRHARTIQLLENYERPFDDWWEFYMEHDTTVMITREEHGSGKKFDERELIKLPPENLEMFTSAGFSFKMRKKRELAWLRNYVDNHRAEFSSEELALC